MEQLTHITLLSPETAKHLQVEHLEMVVMVVLLEMRMMLMVSQIKLIAQDLAQSKISDMNFTKFTAVLEKEITKIDLTSFIRWIMVANLMPAMAMVMETTMAIMTAIDFSVCKAAEGVEGHCVPI